MITKNMTRREERELEEITGYKIQNKVKYLGIWISKRVGDLFENNYKKNGTK